MQLDSDLLARLVGQASAVRTEADIQSDIKMLLLATPDLLPSDGSNSKSLQLEEQLGDGSRRRIDIALGATVIEVKKTLTTEAEASDYIDQLRGYVETRMEQTTSRYNGILSDGRSWWLFEIDPASGKFPLLSKFELTTPKKGADLVAWLQAVLAMPAEVAPKPDAIEDILGAHSPGYAQDKAFLEGMYRSVVDDPTTGLSVNYGHVFYARHWVQVSKIGKSFFLITPCFLSKLQPLDMRLWELISPSWLLTQQRCFLVNSSGMQESIT